MTDGNPTNGNMADSDRPDDRHNQGLEAARAGRESGFGVLYDALHPQLLTFVSRRGAEDPEELANSALFAAFQNLATFTGDYSAFRSFVYRIARNRLVDDYRKQGRRVATVPLDGQTPITTDGGFEDLIGDRDLAQTMLADLTPDQRDVLLLRVAADLSLAETAEAMDKPVSAIKALQRRAVRALHRNLAAEAHS